MIGLPQKKSDPIDRTNGEVNNTREKNQVMIAIALLVAAVLVLNSHNPMR